MNIQRSQDERAVQLRIGERALGLLNGGVHVYLFGTTTYATRVAEHAYSRSNHRITFIDDHKAGQRFADAPVVALADVPKAATVIGCVVEGRPKTVDRLLRAAGLEDTANYYQLNLADPKRFPVPFWDNNVADIDAHLAEYAWLRGVLADDRSRTELDDLLHFRYANDALSGSLTYRLHEQYWEPFIDLGTIHSFVDGGSFDGKTALQFIERQPAYERVDVFEPFPSSMVNAKHTLSGRAHTHFHPFAILNERKSLRFTSSAGSANGLSASGDIEVLTCGLDDELGDAPVGMLKLDIEGAEPEAIEGARNIIRTQRPVLAVCVYHDQSHFWRIPQQVMAIRPDYRVYLRHYSEGVYETVMYFI
ncbi:MAG: FkbM family methyltransferase [Flavobacteriales bacterium]|nr:FkbM family methyltransferase [Flavobacteriales bacterium]